MRSEQTQIKLKLKEAAEATAAVVACAQTFGS
jgi:hypothetical protein